MFLFGEAHLVAAADDTYAPYFGVHAFADVGQCVAYFHHFVGGGNGARVSRLNAYGEMQEGFGVRAEAQNFYCLLNETMFPHLMPVTVYLQIPFFHAPRQLRGMYIGLDYNRSPVGRRILPVKESEDAEAFGELPCGLIGKEALTPEQQAYYDYTCGPGDFIKMCTVPSLRMDETDLTKEKRMLAL